MELNRFAGPAAFTGTFADRKGHCIRPGDLANITMKAAPRTTTKAKPGPKSLQRDLEVRWG